MKVKEKDLPALQAICGQEKYSKNYELQFNHIISILKLLLINLFF